MGCSLEVQGREELQNQGRFSGGGDVYLGPDKPVVSTGWGWWGRTILRQKKNPFKDRDLLKDGVSWGLVTRPAGMAGALRTCGDEEVGGGGSEKVCRHRDGKRCHGNGLRLYLVVGEETMRSWASELASAIATETQRQWHIQIELCFSHATIGLVCIVFHGKSRTQTLQASSSAISSMELSFSDSCL